MAGKVKKGFTSYLVVLIIAVVAAFLIWLSIMLFSPFKSFFGIKYFFYNDEVYEYNSTVDENSSMFDFSTIKTINIDCSYSNVYVRRELKIDNNAIKIENKSKGFAKEDQNTDFTYEISYGNSSKTILNVKVKEPEGFIFFSKEINIKILLPTRSSYSLENTKIDITNTSGNIYLGNNDEETTQDNNGVDVNSLSVKTNSGEFIVFSYADTNFSDLFINSKHGKVAFRRDIAVNNKFELYSESAKLIFMSINYKNDEDSVKMDIADAKFSCYDFVGDVDLSLRSGYFDAESVTGNIVSNNENCQMKSATITIEKVTGAISLPFLNDSDVNIDYLDSESVLYAHSTSGDINLKEVYCNVYLESSSGKINLNTFYDFDVKTKSGVINVVYYNSDIINKMNFLSENGTINLKIKNTLAFALSVYDQNGELRTSGIDIEGIGKNVTNPIVVNGGKKPINMKTNGKVNISML